LPYGLHARANCHSLQIRLLPLIFQDGFDLALLIGAKAEPVCEPLDLFIDARRLSVATLSKHHPTGERKSKSCGQSTQEKLSRHFEILQSV